MRKAKISKSVDSSEPISWIKWNFDEVTEDEIIACCLWEYARESSTINMVANLNWCSGRHIWQREEYERNPNLKAEDDREAAKIQARAKARGFDYEKFSVSLWETDFPLIEIYSTLMEYVREDTCSWPDLPSHLRLKLVNQISESKLLAPLKHATVGELERLWAANRVDLDEVRSRAQAEDDDSEMMALYDETVFLDLPEEKLDEPSKTMVTAFLIDFSRYSDQEITATFQNWLIKHRPARWQKPMRVFPTSPQKGRKALEYRVALERLGLMRLLHFYSPAELQRYVPEAWRKYHRKQQSFRREIRAACEFFHRIFPFVPAGENPIYAERKGKWLPHMRKILDEVERDMKIRGR